MSPMMLAALAAVLAFVAGALTAGEGARAWRMAAGLLVALVALGVSVRAPGGRPGADLVATAVDADGQAVHTTVVLQRTGARRQVRQVPLQRPVGGSGLALVLMAGLGLAGAALTRVRRPGRLAALSGVLPLAGAAGALAVVAGVGPGGAGAEDVRAWLLALGAPELAVTGFTVPEGGWQFLQPATRALGFASVVAAVAAVSVVRPAPDRPGPPWLALGAVGTLAALVWQVLAVGGLPWRATELSLLAATVLLGAAWATRLGGTPTAAAAGAVTVHGGAAAAARSVGAAPAWAPAILCAAAVAVLALGVG